MSNSRCPNKGCTAYGASTYGYEVGGCVKPTRNSAGTLQAAQGPLTAQSSNTALAADVILCEQYAAEQDLQKRISSAHFFRFAAGQLRLPDSCKLLEIIFMMSA